MTFTVGILAYNTDPGVLERTMTSIVAAAKDNPVILAINSNSEEVRESYRVLAEKCGVSHLGPIPNRGFGAGHNEIVRHVSTDWYVCCNPDIDVPIDAFDKLFSFTKSLDSPGLVTCKVLNEDGTIQHLGRPYLTVSSWVHRQLWRLFPGFFTPYEVRFDYHRSQKAEFVSGCFFAVPVIVFRSVGGFDESFFVYCEDADLSRRVGMRWNNFYCAEVPVTHAWGKAWKSSFNGLSNELRSLVKYFCKHGWG